MLSTVTSKGQVTIPKAVRDTLGIGPNDRVLFVQEGDRVFLQPLKTLKAFRGAVRKTRETQDFPAERKKAKEAVASRLNEEER